MQTTKNLFTKRRVTIVSKIISKKVALFAIFLIAGTTVFADSYFSKIYAAFKIEVNSSHSVLIPCTGNADEMWNDFGVANEDRALGAPDGNFAVMGTNDILSLDLTDVLKAGQTFDIRWLTGGSTNIQVDVSYDGYNWTVVTGGNPHTETGTSLNTNSFTAPINMRYVRLTFVSGSGLGVDAISYTSQDCCEIPTFTQSTPAGTCNGTTPNNDASITLNGISVGDRADISTPNATTYDGDNYANAETISGGSITFTNLQHGTDYLVRIYNPAQDCPFDVRIMTADAPAACPAIPTGLPWAGSDCNDTGILLQNGIAAITCGTTTNVPAEDRWAFAMVNFENIIPGTGRSDETANAEPYHHSTWHVDDIGNVFGIAINSTSGQVLLTASSNFGAGFTGQPSILRYGDIAGGNVTGNNDAAAGGAVYILDATSGEATLFTSLPQQPVDFTHTDCEGTDSKARTSTGVGLGNIAYDYRRNQYFVSNFEDGRIYRIDAAGTILDTYDPFGLDDGAAGISNNEELVYGLAISPDGTRLFLGGVDNAPGLNAQEGFPAIHSIDLSATGGFTGTATATGLGYDNFTGTETFHTTISAGISGGSGSGFIPDDYVYSISDLTFNASGDLIAGIRVGCNSSMHTSYNHFAETNIITPTGTTFNNVTELDISVLGDAGPDDGYGGVASYVDANGNDILAVSSADILEEVGPHGIAVFNDPITTDGAGQVSPLAAISYGIDLNGDPKGIGADVEVFAECIPFCEITGTQTTCAGTNGLVYSGPAGSTNYTWTITSGDATINGSNTNQTVTVDAGNNSFSLSLSISPGGPEMCDYAVTVNPNPTCTASNNGPICDGQTITLNETGGDATSWAWSTNGSATLSSTSVQSPTATGVTNGEIFTVTVTDANGCTSTCTTTATVNPLPTITVTGTTCTLPLPSFTYSVDLTTTGNTIMSTAGTVTDNGGGSFTISNIPDGTDITITSEITATGCQQTQSVTAPDCTCPPVNPPTSGGDETICADQTIPALTVTVGVGETADWYANSSGGTPLAGGTGTLSYTPSGAGTFYAEARNTTTSCVSSSRTAVTLTINPSPTCTASNNGPICAGATLTLNETGGNATSWAWTTNGSGTFSSATAQSPTVTSVANGEIFTVVITDANGCTSTCTTTAVVNPLPTCNATNNGPICNGQTLTLNETGGNATSWAWSSNGTAIFSDASAQSPTATGVTNGEIFTVMITDANGCTSTCMTTAVVNDLPTCNATNNGPICIGEDLTLNETGGNATMWAWTTNGTATFNNATLQSPIAVGVNNGEVFTVVITDANGCTSTCTTTAVVNALPTCTASNDGPVCANGTLTLNETGGNATMWAWTTNGSGTFSNASVQSPTVTGMIDGEIFTVVITDANGCTSMCTTTTTVRTAPACSASNNGPICAGEELMLNETGGEATGWSWTTNGSATFNGINGNLTQNPTVSGAVNGEIFTVVITDASGCTSTCTTTAVVNAAPTCNATNDGPICLGETLTLNETGGNATMWAWSTNGGAVLSSNTAQSPTATNVSNGEIFTVVITDANGCTSTCTTTAVVNALPMPVTTSNSPICNGATLNLMETSGVAVSWLWSSNGSATITNTTDQNPTATNVGNGEVFTVVITDANGCTGSSTTTATVNPLPTCSISGSTDVLQNTQDVVYSGTAGMTTYAWSVTSGDAVIDGAANAENVTVDFGTMNSVLELTITDANGCSSTCNIMINVTATLVCNISGPTEACYATTGLSYSAPAGAATYSWSITAGDATITSATNIQTVTVDAGNNDFTIELTLSPGAPATCNQMVTINPPPTCNATNNGPICDGDMLNLNETGGAATMWAWSTNGTSTISNTTIQNPSVTGAMNGEIFTVIITDANGCTSTCNTTAVVNATPTCTASNSGPICDGQTLTLNETGGNATMWAWSTSGTATFNDANLQSPTVTGAANGEVFTVVITDANGCTSTCSTTATVNVLPSCSASNNGPICEGATLTLMEVGGDKNGWAWSSDGSAVFNDATAQNPTATGVTNGEIFTVIVTNAAGCTSTCTTTAVVNAAPTCTASNNGPICDGQSLTLNETGGNATSWAWSTNGSATFDNTMLQSPTITNAANGEVFTVVITDANGCTSMCTTTAVVNALPTCTASNNGPICTGQTLTLNETGGNATTWAWSSDGSAVFNDATAQSPTATGVVNGEVFTVMITDANGCTSMCTTTAVVNALPTCNASNNGPICAGSDLMLNETGGNATMWAWTSDGSATFDNATLQSPTASGAVNGEIFTVVITDANGCTSMCTTTATVNSAPACMATNDGPICEGATLTLNETGGDATGWMWSTNGSATISNITLQNPTAMGVTNGEIFTVITTDANGCTSTCTTTAVVNPLPVCNISGSSPVVQNTQDVMYSGPAGMTTYAWSVTAGDAVIDGASNAQNVTIDFGTMNSTLELTIVDANGCTSTCTFDVTITNTVVCAITGPTDACANTTGLVFNATAGAATYSWAITAGDATINGANNAQSVTVDAGTSDFTIELTLDPGAPPSCTYDVNIFAIPTCTISNNGPICQGQTLSLSEMGGSATSWNWSSDGASSISDATAQNPTATGVSNGEIFTVVITDANGCTSTCTTTATVNPTPTCTASNDGPICEGQTLTLNETGGNATSWAWSSNAGAVFNNATMQSPTATNVINGEIFTVVITDANGCTSTCTTTAVVNPIPVCNITGSTTALNNTQDAVYSGPAGMATYAWSVTAGDAVIDGANNAQNVTIDFGTMNSTIELTIVDANGCTSTCTIDVTMTATLVCAVSGPTDACQNTAGLVYSGPGGASSYAWSITAGDAVINGASNMQNVTVDGGTSSFTIELTIEPGTSTCSQMVTVNPPPTCTVSNNGPICAGQTLTLFESGGDATSWMWSSNSGASISDVTAQNPMATGVTDGEIFTVIITDANGCTSTCNTTATVNPAITEAALMNITCNDNGSTTDPTDDFITFELNPTGNNLGANYNISVSSGTITPTTAAYGASTTFTLQNGSAGSGNVTVTLLDESNTPCPLEVVITDPGNCSGMQIDYPDYNRPGFPPCADEPCHVIDANLRLGTTNTADNGGGGDQMATTDNDDGITFPNDLRPGINIQITANITNNTGNDAYLYAWADWNADGDFDDAGEAFAAETYTNMGNFDVLLPVFIPSNANQADGIAFRFRLSTDETAISSPCGPAACASDGEVEDYIIMLECPTEICLPPTIQINR